MIDTDWFRRRLEERGLSQRQLARLMGIDASAVSLMLRGRRRMTVEEAAQVAVLLQATPSEVLTAAGVAPGGERRLPIIGHLLADSSVRLEPDGLHETVEAGVELPGDAAAVQARTAGTDGAAVDGWVYYLADRHGPPAAAVGQFALTAVRGNGLLMAHVARGYSRGRYNLTTWRGTRIDNVDLAWASPVLWIRTTA